MNKRHTNFYGEIDGDEGKWDLELIAMCVVTMVVLSLIAGAALGLI